MTVPATTRKAGPFNGNGSNTTFPFTFKVFSDGDIQVVRQGLDGAEATLVLDSDYSVVLNGDQNTNPGGSVTYPISGSPLGVGLKLSIVGALDYSQETDLPTGGNFNPTVIENALDKLAMQIQQVDERANRAVSVPVNSTVTGEEVLVQLYEDLAVAAANAASAQAAYDSFDDRYLGAKASDPVSDNDGNALLTGALYWSTSLNRMRAYTGSAWVDTGAAMPVTMNVQRFSGNGSTTVFTLTNAPAFQNAAEVFISGVRQVPGVDYTITGAGLTTLTFIAGAPPSGTNNVFVQTVSAYAGGVPNDGSVTPAKLSASGTPSASTYLRGDNTWANLPGGGTTVVSAGDVTLTAASDRVQRIVNTSGGGYVVLPNATTLSEGEGIFVIAVASGSRAVGVKDAAGNILMGPIYPGKVVKFDLLDNSTSAGSWLASPEGVIPRGGFGLRNASSLTVVGTLPTSKVVRVVALSSTSYLIVYRSNSTTLSAVVATANFSTGAVTFATSVTVEGAVTGSDFSSLSVAALSSTLVAVGFNSGAHYYVRALSISGTTITVGAAASAFGGVVSNARSLQVIALGASAGLVSASYFDGTTWQNRVVAFSVSGTTVSFGTVSTLNSPSNVPDGVMSVLTSSTSFVTLFFNPDGPNLLVRAYTFSGTTLTGGSIVNVGAGSQNVPGQWVSINRELCYSPGSNYALFVGMNSSSLMVWTSGTTVNTTFEVQSLELKGGDNPLWLTPVPSTNEALIGYGYSKPTLMSAVAGEVFGSVTPFPSAPILPYHAAFGDSTSALVVGLLSINTSTLLYAQTLKVI